MHLNIGKNFIDIIQKKGKHICLTEDIAIINLKSPIKKAAALAIKNLINLKAFRDSNIE